MLVQDEQIVIIIDGENSDNALIEGNLENLLENQGLENKESGILINSEVSIEDSENKENVDSDDSNLDLLTIAKKRRRHKTTNHDEVAPIIENDQPIEK